jgi:5-methylcytosine-specific restriction enzyme A
MPWTNSNRKDELPKNWPHLRNKVLKRAGYQCEFLTNGVRCTARATDVDHKIRGNNHSLSNLQALCPDHHARKSAMEGVEARKAKYSRRVEPHPGYIGNED